MAPEQTTTRGEWYIAGETGHIPYRKDRGIWAEFPGFRPILPDSANPTGRSAPVGRRGPLSGQALARLLDRTQVDFDAAILRAAPVGGVVGDRLARAAALGGEPTAGHTALCQVLSDALCPVL